MKMSGRHFKILQVREEGGEEFPENTKNFQSRKSSNETLLIETIGIVLDVGLEYCRDLR